MHIMVAGASGQIGREIVQNLSKSNKIFAIYRKKKNFFDLKNKNIKWIKFDLSKKIKLRINPKIIINCAATHEFSPKKNLQNYLDSNIISMANLIAFAKEKKVKKIINLSTISVYGAIDVNLLHEDYIPINQNLLGRTKYISEYLLYNQPINFINLRFLEENLLFEQRHRVLNAFQERGQDAILLLSYCIFTARRFVRFSHRRFADVANVRCEIKKNQGIF